MASGYTPDDLPRNTKNEGRNRGWPEGKLQVLVGVGRLGQLGLTACVAFLDTNVGHRGLHVYGAIITAEQPVYRDEVAVLHARRTPHVWLHSTSQLQIELNSITVSAGSGQSV